MKKTYVKEVTEGLNRVSSIKTEFITEQDFQHLPSIVKKYLALSGVVGQEKILNFRAKFKGKIRSKPTDSWMNFTSVQFNFFDKPTRIFLIKARKMGIPVNGIHLYKDQTAIMVIRIAGLFNVADAKGAEMNQGETVTIFNDMCFMAPATLISTNITWEIIDSLSVKASYSNGGITIGATLLFNEKGELINFKSNDRFETADGETFINNPWSTPINEYKTINGHRTIKSASVIFHRPDSDFCYGEFELLEIEYNCQEL